jgi:hypothetical protein
LDGVIFQHLQKRRYFVQDSSEDTPSHILDAAERKFPVFTADAASFKYSVDHYALTHLHVFIMIAKKEVI